MEPGLMPPTGCSNEWNKGKVSSSPVWSIVTKTMPFVRILLLVSMVVSVACSSSTVPLASAPLATPTAYTPQPTPCVPSSVRATIGATAKPIAERGIISTPTASSNLAIKTAPSHPIVQVQFPNWIEESPEMAQLLGASSVIAKARFVSLESATRKHNYWGYVAELTYKFEVFQYLKGGGGNELVVRMGSGPRYEAFPDVIGQRSEDEACDLAEHWHYRSVSRFVTKRDGILLLRSDRAGGYHFTSVEDDERYLEYPAIGETWLVEQEAPTYLHGFARAKTTTISFFDLEARIQFVPRLKEGEYAGCVSTALSDRTRVRDQILGTYRILDLGGYREPEPFPKKVATIASAKSAHATVFESRNPHNRSARFSNYWLDGRDRDLFDLETRADSTHSYERLRTSRALPQGRYFVHYNAFHMALPCRRFSEPGRTETSMLRLRKGPFTRHSSTRWLKVR